MSSFTEAKVERIADRLYCVVEPFRWYFGYVGSTLYVDVPRGFLTDLVSGPRWIIRLIPKPWRRRMAAPAIVHDRLREDMRFAKVDGDVQFLSALLANEVPWPLAMLAFVGVSFNNSRKVRNL